MKDNPIDLTGSKILIVDDQPTTVDVLRERLESQGYRISVATGGERALELANRIKPDLILLDIRMPGISGLETCRRLKQNESTQALPVIFITAYNETEQVIAGFQAGGVDYICKPFEPEEALIRIKTHLTNAQLTKALVEEKQRLEQEMLQRKRAEDALQTADEHLSLISQQEAKRWGVELIAQSQTMAKLMAHIRRLHNHDTTNVLILGESGTGKEMVARAIHFGSPRAENPFIPVNCAAISKTLAESEFFGYVRGAFTGAEKDKKGYFELANGGTLFLDEVGEMPLELQAKLLRVLEDKRFMPVGGGHEKRVDVRILSATNVELEKKIAAGEFREDLYHRLAVFPVTLPPLRERKEDIPLLVSHFLNRLAVEMRLKKPQLSEEALTALKSYHFPGNIRELKNIIERALIESGGATIQPEHLHLTSHSESASDLTESHTLIQHILSGKMGFSEAVARFQQQVVKQVLAACHGNGYQAAELLQMHRPNLTRLIKRLKMDEVSK